MQHRLYIVPSEMRQHDRLAAQPAQGSDSTRNPSEPGSATLIARLRQNLHANTNAQHRYSSFEDHFIQRLTHSRSIEQFHRVIESANTRKMSFDAPRNSSPVTATATSILSLL